MIHDNKCTNYEKYLRTLYLMILHSREQMIRNVLEHREHMIRSGLESMICFSRE